MEMLTRSNRKVPGIIMLWTLFLLLLPTALVWGAAFGNRTASYNRKLVESRQDYFRRYFKCYLENYRSSRFRQDMDQCMSPGSTSAMGTFRDYQELEDYLKEQYSTRVRSNEAIRLDVDTSFRMPAANTDEAPSNATADSSDAAGSADRSGEFSETNVQELGVDEADTVKTDGEYFYVGSGGKVEIVALQPAMEVVGTIDMGKMGSVTSLYLYQETLVVLYDSYEPLPKPLQESSYGWRRNNVGVAFYDVSSPAAPELIKAVEMEGYLVSSRRIDNKLHVVQQFMPFMPPIRYYFDATMENKAAVVQENEESVAELGLEQLMPYYRVVYPESQSSQIFPLVSPGDFYKPTDEDGGGQIATVVTFDLDRLQGVLASVGIVADATSVYASTQALYVLSNRWNDDQASDSRARQQTEIYKFDLTGADVTAVASGRVNGTILNQFSLGEYDDVLRVATNTRIWTDNQSEIYSHIFCLRENGATLEVAGKIEDLAFGEQIYAARFVGQRGFLVTFVNVDPLFTLDLSDPTAPKVVGELKVPGYSDYIHPWGENYLITIGKDAASDETMTWYQGVQLSVFDITQFDRPTLLHKLIIGDRGTQSEANRNHKAFTFWPEHNLLAIPIDLYEIPDKSEETPPNTYGTYVSSGLYVFRVSKEAGFEKLGILPVSISASTQGIRYNAWTRGIFVEDNIYSVTPSVIHSAVIDTIDETIQALPLAQEDEKYPPSDPIIDPMPVVPIPVDSPSDPALPLDE